MFTVETIAWKDESHLGGPIWINDELVEIDDKPIWFTYQQAFTLASFFKLDLEVE
jgi:hypothetical protein